MKSQYVAKLVKFLYFHSFGLPFYNRRKERNENNFSDGDSKNVKIWYLLLNRKFSGVIVKIFNNIRVLFMSCMVNECSLDTMVDVLINIEIFKRKLEEVEIWDKVL